MSGGDPLDRMVRALRDEGDAPAPQAKLTKERILRDLRPKARGRKWTWAIPIAALLAGSTVLAATGQLPAIVKSAKELFIHAPPEDAPHAQGKLAETAPAAPAPAPAPETPPASEPKVDEAPAPVATADTPKTAAPRVHAEPSARRNVAAPAIDVVPAVSAPVVEQPAPSGATSAAPAAAVETDDALSLYRHAHHLYFTEQNPGAALAAFDEYLAKNPKSPLVVDARYDRALCLVRLGRNTEARAALQPFADGRYGAYRQKDATRLLEALEKTPSK